MKKTNKPPVRQESEKSKLIEALKKSAIVQLACQQANVALVTYYRWRQDDASFAKACDEAMTEGTNLVSDLAESKLVGAIKEQNMAAISFWLRHRHPAYAEKLQIQAKVETNTAMTPEQEELVRRALDHVSKSKQLNQDEYDNASPATE